jgi:hypothetical protein
MLELPVLSLLWWQAVHEFSGSEPQMSQMSQYLM